MAQRSRRERLLASLQDRLERLAQSRDPQLLLDPAILEESAELLAGIEIGAVAIDAATMHGVGWLHWARYQLLPPGEDQQDLALALQYFQRVRQAAPELETPEELAAALQRRDVGGDPQQWNAEAGDLVRRFDQTGDPEHLDGAVALLNRVLAAVPEDHPGRPIYLSNLSGALRQRYEARGDIADLDTAVELARVAVQLTDETDADHPARLSLLATAIQFRHERHGAPADLDEALDLHSRAAQAVRHGDPDEPAILTGLANTLRLRYQSRGDSADLDEAVRLHERIAEIISAGDPQWAGHLSNLATALQQRYEATGDTTDADRAIDLLRKALRGVPAGHPARAGLLTNLGIALQNQYARKGELASLEEAIDVGREALELIPPGHPAVAIVLSNLGLALHQRFQRTRSRGDRDDAVAALEQALNLTPAEHRDHAGYLTNLATVLLHGHPLLDDPGELDQAILVLRQVADRTPADDPQHAFRLHNLSVALHRRHLLELGFDREGLDDAITAAWQAASSPLAPPSTRAHAARNAGDWMVQRGDLVSATQAFRLAVDLLPRMASRHLIRADQEYQLSSLAGVAGDAAACALNGGEPDAAARALELLEYGRGVLLAQALETRWDLTELRERHPEFADRFVQLRQLFETPPEETRRPGPSAGMDRRQLAEEWDRLNERIRAQPGFASWLRPPQVADLAASAASGPVIVVNVSQLRSDALVLTTDGVEAIHLPEVSPEAVDKAVESFLHALDTAHDPMAEPLDRRGAEARIVDLLAWLWDAVASPVLSAHGLDHRPSGDEWPRVWWCPTGMLSFLPLHAAGRHDQRQSPGERANAVIDCVVSSYTPTVRSLQHSRTKRTGSSAGRGRLAVALPQTPGRQGLQAAHEEGALLAQRFPEATILIGEAATLDRVRAELGGSAWVHFACHGRSDMNNPSAGHLNLYDRELSVLDVSHLQLKDAELAYLSACSTARGSQRLADEAIHIAAAFQLAGYAHVIGTLWPIADELAPRIAQRLYQTIADDLSNTAACLHFALRDVRDQYHLYAMPSLWAAHVHAGP